MSLEIAISRAIIWLLWPTLFLANVAILNTVPWCISHLLPMLWYLSGRSWIAKCDCCISTTCVWNFELVIFHPICTDKRPWSAWFSTFLPSAPNGAHLDLLRRIIGSNFFVQVSWCTSVTSPFWLKKWPLESHVNFILATPRPLRTPLTYSVWWQSMPKSLPDSVNGSESKKS